MSNIHYSAPTTSTFAPTMANMVDKSHAQLDLSSIAPDILAVALVQVDCIVDFDADGRVVMFDFNTITDKAKLPRIVAEWARGNAALADELRGIVAGLTGYAPEAFEPASVHEPVSGGIADRTSMFITPPPSSTPTPATFSGAAESKFFTVDLRICLEVLRLGYAIGKPTELLALYVMLCRGVTHLMGPMTKWSRKAFRKYTGVSNEVAVELHAALIEAGFISQPIKTDMGTWYIVKPWADLKGITEEPEVTSRHCAIVATTFIDGEQIEGAKVDPATLGIRRLLSHGRTGNHRADNADAFVTLLAMRAVLDRDATGGVPATDLWRAYGPAEKVAGRGNRVAYAFAPVYGGYQLDHDSRFARTLAPLLAATTGGLDSALKKLRTLKMVGAAIVAMDRGQALFAMTLKEAMAVTDDATSLIETGVGYEGHLEVSIEDELCDKTIVPFHIEQDEPELREALVPSYAPETGLMIRLQTRFAEQNLAPVKSLRAIEASGGLKVVAEFWSKITV
jgi:hypothetical protein